MRLKRIKNKKINLLDCTLRDGGYYNNWNFDKKLIQEYLLTISRLKIGYVELGFRTIEKNKIKGLTAYTSNNLINNLKIPKDISIGVMINASDLLSNRLSAIQNCKNIFSEIIKSKIKFVRFACHYEEVFFLKDCIRWLKEKKIIVFVNIMQITEIKSLEIKKVCTYLKNAKADILYMADSLGSLNSRTTKKIVGEFNKNWNSDLGLHAHNNLGLACKNSILANEKGVKWIDSTITGMGRGPGNLKTEEILRFVTNDKRTSSIINKLIKRYFIKLKNKYKWGPNKYYALAAKHKIHPTYIQKLISDKRYNETEYLNIINILKKIGAKKFNPYKLINSSYFLSEKPKGSWSPRKALYDRKVLIVGPGDSVEKSKSKIQQFIIKNNLFVIGLNSVNSIEEKLIDLRIACHPIRILSDVPFHNRSGSKLAMPYSMLSKRIRNSIKLNKRIVLDYGLSLNHDEKIKIKNNYCTLPYPLAIGYSLCVAISGKAKKIYLAGLDGYESIDPNKDNTAQLLKNFKKMYFKGKLSTLTPSNYNSTLQLIKIN